MNCQKARELPPPPQQNRTSNLFRSALPKRQTNRRPLHTNPSRHGKTLELITWIEIQRTTSHSVTPGLKSYVLQLWPACARIAGGIAIEAPRIYVKGISAVIRTVSDTIAIGPCRFRRCNFSSIASFSKPPRSCSLRTFEIWLNGTFNTVMRIGGVSLVIFFNLFAVSPAT